MVDKGLKILTELFLNCSSNEYEKMAFDHKHLEIERRNTMDGRKITIER